MSKSDYNKMTNIQQMEFDLEQMNTQAIKDIMKTKHKGKRPTVSIYKTNKAKHTAYNKLDESGKLEYDLEEGAVQRKELRHAIRNKGYKAKKLNSIFEKVIGKYEPKIKFIKNLKFKGKDIISMANLCVLWIMLIWDGNQDI